MEEYKAIEEDYDSQVWTFRVLVKCAERYYVAMQSAANMNEPRTHGDVCKAGVVIICSSPTL
jgi:hypothetical protein